MLASFGAAVPVNQVLTGMDYAAQELRVNLPEASEEEQERLTLTLKQQGLTAAWKGAQWVLKLGQTP
jgi:hypothetical protein